LRHISPIILALTILGIAVPATASVPVTAEAGSDFRVLHAGAREGVMQGGHAGLRIDEQHQLSVAILSLNERRAPRDGGGAIETSLAYGGLTYSADLVNTGQTLLSLDVLLGGGIVCDRNTPSATGACPGATAFLLVEPGVSLAVKLDRHTTFGFWVGYRAAVSGEAAGAQNPTPSMSGLASTVQVNVAI
jgi:hypothetical protein